MNFQLPNIKLLSVEMRDFKVLKDQNGWWNNITVEEKNRAMDELQMEVRLELLKKANGDDLELQNSLRSMVSQTFTNAFDGAQTSPTVTFEARPN